MSSSHLNRVVFFSAHSEVRTLQGQDVEESPSLEVLKKMPGCGTWCHVLGDRVGISQRLGSVIFEVFCSLKDPVIPSVQTA